MALGSDEPLAINRGGVISYYSADGLGSVALLNDGGGTVQNSYVYDAWSQTRSQTGSLANPFTYTAREVGEAGLNFYRARYYSPGVGRFLQEDPMEFLDREGASYSYVINNPIAFLDPWGLLHWNKPPPQPVPVTGQTLINLQCVENCLSKRSGNPNLDLLMTGGAEQTGHSANSHHYTGQACDIAGPRSNPVASADVMNCASQCGFGAGQLEIYPDSPNRDHWHLQLHPGNGVPPLPTVLPMPRPTPR